MKTQYTPGPWKIERVGAAGFPQIVCRDHAKFDGAVIATEICNGEANARLIAAAPLMYEALKELGDWDLHSKCADGTPAKNAEASLANVRRFARAAITAAEGN